MRGEGHDDIGVEHILSKKKKKIVDFTNYLTYHISLKQTDQLHPK